jgi:hypothetical protein
VEIGTKKKMDSLICAYFGHNSQELVHRTRSAQRDKRLGIEDQEIQDNI